MLRAWTDRHGYSMISAFRPSIFPHRILLWLVVGLIGLNAASASAQDKFRARNYRVRVAVAHEVENLVLKGNGYYQILSSDGSPLGTLVSDQPYFARITRGRPGDQVYRLVLAELD